MNCESSCAQGGTAFQQMQCRPEKAASGAAAAAARSCTAFISLGSLHRHTCELALMAFSALKSDRKERQTISQSLTFCKASMVMTCCQSPEWYHTCIHVLHDWPFCTSLPGAVAHRTALNNM